MENTKVMTAAQAVEKFVHDGDCIAMGGFVTNRRPYVLTREIINSAPSTLAGPHGALAQ